MLKLKDKVSGTKLCGKLLFSSFQNGSIYTAFRGSFKEDFLNGIFIVKTKKLERFLLEKGFQEIKEQLEKCDFLEEKFSTVKNKLDRNKFFKNKEEFYFFEELYEKLLLLESVVNNFIVNQEGTWLLSNGSCVLNEGERWYEEEETIKSIVFELSYENAVAFKQLFGAGMFNGIETLEDFNSFFSECEKEAELTLFYIELLKLL